MVDLLVNQRQTEDFIERNPSDVVLSREVRADDGAGGYTTTATPLTSQRVRVVQQRQNSGTERRNQAGEVVRPAITLVMKHDADVQRGDTFDWQGLDAEVVWVTDLRYVKHAEVAI